MISIKTSQVLVNFKGENLKHGTEDLTIGIAISTILGGKVSNPAWGWLLGKKFATQEEVDLKAEEIVFIKKEIEDNSKSPVGFFSVANGQLLEILDGAKESK